MRAWMVLLLVPLAGCLDGTDSSGLDPETDYEPSEARFGILPVEEVWVTSTDGKRIHNALYRPDTDDGVPVFINFSPYWGDSAETGGDAFAQYMIHEYVPRGFAVVLSSVRGTGHSEGCFQIGGDVEVADSNVVIDHFASASWSNGAVAAGGKSYDSTTQNGVIAKDPHPALKGIFHVSGITDMYRYNYRNGEPYLSGTIFNTYYYGQTIHEYGLPLPIGGGSPQGASEFDEDEESLARAVDDAACTEFPAMQASGVGSGVSGLKDAYWKERDWNQFVGASDWDGGVFFVHGLQDWNVKPDHILPWLDMLPADVQLKVWLHQWQQSGTGHVYPMRDDWNETMLAFLDATLLGKPSGFFDGPVFDVQSDDMVWRQSETWPMEPTEFGPSQMVCNSTCSTLEMTLLEAETVRRVSGEIHIRVTVVPNTEDPMLTAIIYRERDGERTWVTEAVLRAIYRDTLEDISPVTVGMPFQARLETYPVDTILFAGDKLVAVFGDDSRFVVKPTGSRAETPDGTGVDTAGMATYDVDTYLLSSPPADAGTQPSPMDCFAC